MPKTLLLLRHAKSSWKDERLSDHDRPLNRRGKLAAPRMGRLIRDQGIVPERILSSTAARARATAEAVAEACGFEGEIELLRELYLAAPIAYIDAARQVDGDPARVLLVGHNPAVNTLVRELTSSDEVMPTAALARIELPVLRWSELDLEVEAELLGLWRPRELD
jgi:phosphohistidine phosphatase